MSVGSESFVYAGLGTEGGREGHGFYRRALSENTWHLTTTGLPQDPEVRTIAIAPDDPSVLYTGVQDGAYRSADRGNHWEKLDLPDDPGTIWSVAFHPHDPQIIYVGGEDTKLFRTNDAGTTWDRVPIDVTFPSVTMTPRVLPKRILSIAIDPNRPDDIYAAVEVGGLIRSRDGGLTWEGSSEGHYQNDDPVDLHGVLVSSAHPRHVFIISRIGMFRSIDGGDHWSWGKVERLGPNGTYCRVIREAPKDPDTIYLGTGPDFRGDMGALFRSHDYGETWQKVEMGVIPESTLFGFVINQRNQDQMYCATRHGQVLGSQDGGVTWDDYSLPNEASEVNALACG